MNRLQMQLAKQGLNSPDAVARQAAASALVEALKLDVDQIARDAAAAARAVAELPDIDAVARQAAADALAEAERADVDQEARDNLDDLVASIGAAGGLAQLDAASRLPATQESLFTTDSNANGVYYRFAGLQLCIMNVNVPRTVTSDYLYKEITFPAQFADGSYAYMSEIVGFNVDEHNVGRTRIYTPQSTRCFMNIYRDEAPFAVGTSVDVRVAALGRYL